MKQATTLYDFRPRTASTRRRVDEAARRAIRERCRLSLDIKSAATISRTLTEYRMRCGMTQYAVALQTGIGTRTISTLETGRRVGTITLAQLLALLGAYAVSFGTFLYDVNAGER